MKNDINLLLLRKNKPKNEKSRTYVLLVILFIVVMIAGIVLPSRTRSEAQIKLANLEHSLSAFSITQESYDATVLYAGQLNSQRAELEQLHASRSDMLSYLAVLDDSLAYPAILSRIDFSGNMLVITGISPNDKIVADFCQKLRDSGTFANVFLTSSAFDEDEELTIFSVIATLPTALEGSAVVDEGNQGEPSMIENASNIQNSQEGAQ